MIKLTDKNNRRVVVTGMGVVSSLGIGWEEFWKNLIAGKSGISKISAFDTSQYDRHYAGEVKGFNANLFIDKRKAILMGRSSQMAITASKLALEDGKLILTEGIRSQTAVCVGMTMAEMGILEGYHDGQFSKRNNVKKQILAMFPSN